MIRVIIDSQSNRLFQGIPSEQDYDQRGGLCQVGEGNIVITTNPIDGDYLKYWQEIGFSLPYLLTAGPFDPNCTLSDLIIRNPTLQQEIKSLVNGSDARLEFFCIENSERELAEVLGIEPYCNFDVSIHLSRKHNFKSLCKKIGLSTPEWLIGGDRNDLAVQGQKLLSDYSQPFLVKSVDGTGGISCGGMALVTNKEELTKLCDNCAGLSNQFILEYLIPDKAIELSIHWQITKNHELLITNIFGQLSDNFAYTGAYGPVSISPSIKDEIISTLKNIFAPALIESSAIGFFCCDLIIDTSGKVFWIDFNPRKGAIIYIHDMISRLSRNIFNGEKLHFFHRHCHIDRRLSFWEIYEKIGHLLVPSKELFVVITNPGLIEHGYIDITGISHYSIDEAKESFTNVEKTLKSCFTG